MRKAYIQLHLSIILAGFTGILGKLITLNEGLLSWYRLFISGTLMWIFLMLSGRLKKTGPGSLLQIAASGVLLALHWLFFYGSIKYSNVSVGVVCFSMTGFFTAILGPVMNRKPMSIPNLLYGSLALCGIALICHFDSVYQFGILLGVISSVIIAIFTVFNERLTRLHNTETITVYQLLGGLVGLSILMPLYLRLSPSVSLIPSSMDLIYLLVMSVFCTILLYWLATQSLRKLSAFTVNLSFNLEPVYSILLAMIVFHENRELGVSFYAGLVLILLSVVLSAFKRQ